MLFPGYGMGAEMVRAYPVASANIASAIAEGVGMTFKTPLEDGVAKVQIGSTASTDTFAGVTYFQYRVLPTKLVKIDEGKVPATSTYTYTLSRVPLAAATELRVVVTSALGVSTVLAYHASVVNPTQFTISGSTITVDSTFAGYSIKATYAYTPSAFEARDFYGDVRPGISNTSNMGIINVIQKGTIVTSNFNPASDWADSNPVRLDTAGTFTKAGSTAIVPNCIVKEAPSANKPFLTLELR